MGVKNPRYLFVFTGTNEEDEGCVSISLVRSKNGARVLFYSTCIDFAILYFLIIIITNAGTWCGGRCAGWYPLGPGFDSQVPQNPCFYFSYHNHVQAFKGVPPYTSNTQVPSGHKLESDGHDWKTMVLPSQSTPGQSQKVKQACETNGPEIPD